MSANMNRKGISNVVATIILIAVAIALAVAVAVWVFGIGASASKTATLQIQAMSLYSNGTLILMVYNPSSSAISINAFALGGLTCTLQSGQNPITIPSGANGELTIKISSSGYCYIWVIICFVYMCRQPNDNSRRSVQRYCCNNKRPAVPIHSNSKLIAQTASVKSR